MPSACTVHPSILAGVEYDPGIVTRAHRWSNASIDVSPTDVSIGGRASAASMPGSSGVELHD
jgi:hypothetical protein